MTKSEEFRQKQSETIKRTQKELGALTDLYRGMTCPLNSKQRATIGELVLRVNSERIAFRYSVINPYPEMKEELWVKSYYVLLLKYTDMVKKILEYGATEDLLFWKRHSWRTFEFARKTVDLYERIVTKQLVLSKDEKKRCKDLAEYAMKKAKETSEVLRHDDFCIMRYQDGVMGNYVQISANLMSCIN